MNEAKSETPLFNDFTPVNAQTWEERIRKDLREASYHSLLWQTDEGITVKPFYTRQDLPENLVSRPDDFPFVRTTKARDNQWDNVQTIYVRRESQPSIDKAATALERGATGIHFILKEPVDFDFGYLFSKPFMRGASISFTFPVSPETYLEQYLKSAKENNYDLTLLRGFIQFEPIDDEPFHLPAYACIPPMLDLVKDAPNLYPIAISGQQFSNRGSLLTQEIALVLSAAVSVIENCEKHNIAPEKVISRMQFHVTAGTNYFFEIAKLRALRLLWSAIVSSYGLHGEIAGRLRIHVSTSRWFQTVFDPHVNLLRGTTQAMSAVLGGCDSLSIAPFDQLYKTPDDFSERISRNISVILKEEAYLDKAIDPAAGSYYLESLTKEIAEKAWECFQLLESKGGFKKSLESEFIAAEIKKITEQKFKALTNREHILVGTNKYPNANEKVDFDPERLMQSKYYDTNRAAYPFEIMRLASEMHFQKRKKKARALIAVIGTKLNEHLHASFAKEFFECANFDTHVYHFENVEDAAATLQNNDSKIIVLSGSEEQYQHFTAEFTGNLKGKPQKPVLILAATPQHMETEMTAKGFDQYIFQGCDIGTLVDCVQKKVLLEDEPLD
ncbi:methylmalonyl-CoA mutase [Adhaeribacter sp. BT258]|uniref:Methylmalonyl-CoA mutase n=1 Tax=Adhaeribacter terrigena TaxID=2793070 RepID=A0ABS1BXU0_9BACT|nr:methylmalonyl-CoA mutase family protein [Adhaeribacter terrigena]MBK0401966.1 methylmalonyl-CoA mutase [Adhaeribacter terrigena]